MSFSRISALAGILFLASTVASHGTVTGIVADGVYYQGFSPNFNYMQNPPKVAGWTTTYQDNGFIAPSQYTTSEIACHIGATPGGASATVAAGGSIDLQWTVWPVSHKGPVIDYLASVSGEFAAVDKDALKFFKIDSGGLVDGSSPPGLWASDDLIANNNTWTVKIPSDITPGKYVLRHEIIALHSAGNPDGAQNYPQCFNLEVTGSGSATPTGVVPTELYTPTDAGILFNIYRPLTDYPIPGPELYSGGSGSSPAPTSTAGSSSAASTSAPAVTSAITSTSVSAPVVTSAPSTTSGVLPPYTNSTFPTSSKTKSACKPKSKKPTSVTTTLPVSTVSVVPTPLATPTATSDGVTTSTPTPPPTESETPVADSLPEGTKLSSVLKWISKFYTKYGDGEYVSNDAIKRHHARHLSF